LRQAGNGTQERAILIDALIEWIEVSVGRSTSVCTLGCAELGSSTRIGSGGAQPIAGRLYARWPRVAPRPWRENEFT
jgi:hypothetical protein